MGVVCCDRSRHIFSRSDGRLFNHEQDGGNPGGRTDLREAQFYGEVKDFTLKHSHIGIQYSTNYFNQVKGDPPSLFPEIKATLSWADYVSGNDPAINAIRQYSGPD